VEVPLGGEPSSQGRSVGRILLLDPRATRDAAHVWMSDASVLVNLTEQVLAVDQLQPTPAEPIEGQAQPVEVLLLAVDHVADYLGFQARRTRAKQLPKPFAGAGA